MSMPIQHHTASQHNRTQQQHSEHVQIVAQQNMYEQQESYEHLRIPSYESLRHKRSPSAIGTPPVTTIILRY